MLKLILSGLLLAGFCSGQQTPAPFSWLTRLPSDPAITGEQRVRLALHNNFLSAGAILRVMGPAVAGQMSDSPSEWENTAAGFGRQLGTQFAVETSRGLISSGSAAIIGRDPRYQRCDCKGVGRRMGYALSGLVLSAGSSGKRQFDPSSLFSAYGGGYIGASLYPDRYRVSVKGYQLGSQQAGQ